MVKDSVGNVSLSVFMKVVDVVVFNKLIVNKVDDNDKVVIGKVEVFFIVIVKVGSKLFGFVKVFFKGMYFVKILV